MTTCFFVSDLHGKLERYRKLFKAIADETPDLVFLGGDLLPHQSVSLNATDASHHGFVNDFLVANFTRLKRQLGDRYPRVFIILGNDDVGYEETAVLDAATEGIWEYVHNRRTSVGDYSVYGYANVPPTPFQLKDWERYDVSRYVDPGCISPEEGHHTVPVPEQELRYGTIQNDLERLAGNADLKQAVFLFHTPPYNTCLDRAALDDQMIDHVPLDVHVGSIAVRRFIESRQPYITLHGHIHESARLTGRWQERIGKTTLLSAAHDGPELALVRFELEHPDRATRELV